MCLIVDNNVIRRVVEVENDPDFGDIRRALTPGAPYPATLVYERQLLAEYSTNRAVGLLLLQLNQAGRARLSPDAPIQAEIAALQQSGLCVSNDLHILALARVESIGLLCSLDQNLHTDFRNKSIIDNPRGNVYQNSAHSHLLRRFCRKKTE